MIRLRARLSRVLPLMCCALMLAFVAPAGAQSDEDEKQEKPEKKRRWGRRKDDAGRDRSYTMDPRTQKRFSEAYEFYQAEQYDAVDKSLGKLRMRSLNPYERAMVFRMKGFAAYAREEVGPARELLEKAIAENALPEDLQTDLTFNIAQMWLQDQEWAKGIEYLEKYIALVETPNATPYHLIAIAYFQQQEFEKALGPAQKAYDISDEPSEGVLQLLLALRLTRKEYRESVPLLEELVARYPKKKYYMQLSTVHGALESYEKAVVPLQLAYAQDLLDQGPDYRRLAQLLLYIELPYRAALVMQDGIDAGLVKRDEEAFELLSNSWIASREYERAVEPLERGAQIAKTGDLYIRLAQVHLQREKWGDAAHALRKAIDKGGLKNEGDAKLLMGIALYSEKRPEQARTWFQRAKAHANSREEADVWLKHIARELGETQTAAADAAP